MKLLDKALTYYVRSPRRQRISNDGVMTLLALVAALVAGSSHAFPSPPTAIILPTLSITARRNQGRRQPNKPQCVSALLTQASRSSEDVRQPSLSSIQTLTNPSRNGTSAMTPSSTAGLETLDDDQQQQAAYKRGLMTIAGITLLFASNSPVLHAVYATTSENMQQPPPVLLVTAAVSVVALGACWLANIASTSSLRQPSDNSLDLQQEFVTADASMRSLIPDDEQQERQEMPQSLSLSSPTPAPLFQFLFGPTQALSAQAGAELGIYKFLGTLCNIYGLSMTSSTHGALLIQLTTLLVPVAQGLQGVPIPKRIWTAIGLALGGVYLFTAASYNDIDGGGGGGGGGNSMTTTMALQGDLACIMAAVFYATYDLRLFHYGKLIDAAQLITNKIVVQTTLAVLAAIALARQDSMEYLSSLFGSSSGSNHWTTAVLACLWSGIAVNAVAPFLQVGGQQAVGPVRAQIIYASQPLWAALMSFVCLGETVGPTGMMGGGAFLVAMMLAATADVPDPNCSQDVCEV